MPDPRLAEPRRSGGWFLVAAALVVTALVGGAVVTGDDEEDVSFVAVGPGANPRVAALDDDGRLAVFDLLTGERLSNLTDADDGGPIIFLAPSSDGRSLHLTRRTARCDARIERIDLETGQITIPVPEERPGAPVAIAAAGEKLAYTTMACGADEPEVVIGEERIPLPTEGGIALSPDGTLVAVVVDGEVRVLDPLYGTTTTLGTDGCGAHAPAFRGDGGLLAVTCDLGERRDQVVALFDPFTGERLETLFPVGSGVGLSATGDDVLVLSLDDGVARWDGTAVAPLPFLDGGHAAVVIPDAPVAPPEVPFGADIGPALDPSALDLPDTGVVVQLETREIVVFVTVDGDVLGHLDGYTLMPKPWWNPPLRGAGPLVLGRGDEVVVLEDGRLVPVEGAPGSLPLANGAVLEPGPVLRTRADGDLQVQGEVTAVSADRSWVTVVADDGRTMGYWVGDDETTWGLIDTGCTVADTVADGTHRLPVILCDRTVRINDTVVREGGPFPPVRLEDGTEVAIGHWTAAQLSDDGRSLLLQHSGECEAQSGWRLDLATGALSSLGPTDEAWDGGGAGWLSDGRVVASFGPGICGTVFPDGPGVYVEEASGEVTLVYATPGGVTYMGAVLWRQADA